MLSLYPMNYISMFFIVSYEFYSTDEFMNLGAQDKYSSMLLTEVQKSKHQHGYDVKNSNLQYWLTVALTHDCSASCLWYIAANIRLSYIPMST